MQFNVTAEDMDYFSVGYKVGKWLFEDINEDNIQVGVTSGSPLISPELLIQADVGYITTSDEVVLPEELLPYFSEVYRKDFDYKKTRTTKPQSDDEIVYENEYTYTVIPVTCYEFVVPSNSDIFKTLVGTFWMGNMKATKLNIVVTVKSLYPVKLEELFSGTEKLYVSFKSKGIAEPEKEQK